jgi:hypothetical protein
LINFFYQKIKRNHFLFGMVSSIMPLLPFGYYNQNPSQTQLNEHQMIEPRRITVSRNFTTSGDGKSLLHQTFDTKIVGRNSNAPLRTAINLKDQFEAFPAGLL